MNRSTVKIPASRRRCPACGRERVCRAPLTRLGHPTLFVCAGCRKAGATYDEAANERDADPVVCGAFDAIYAFLDSSKRSS